MNREETIDRLRQWLEQNECKNAVVPGLFDLAELWVVNKRERWFNTLCLPLYVLFLFFAVPYSSLCVAAALVRSQQLRRGRSPGKRLVVTEVKGEANEVDQ